MKEFLISLIAIVGFSFIMVFWAYRICEIECNFKAKAMGVNHEYGAFKGCIITTKNGEKLPLENYRVID